MDNVLTIIEAFFIPEVGILIGFLILLMILWIVSRRMKHLKTVITVLESGHLENYYQSSEMRFWRKRLIEADRTNMKDIQLCSSGILSFFERLGLLVRKDILPDVEIWQNFGIPIMGYFSLLVPYIQWLRTEERNSDLYSYFEDLNDVIYRLNRKVHRKQAQPLMSDEELEHFISEEKTFLETF